MFCHIYIGKLKENGSLTELAGMVEQYFEVTDLYVGEGRDKLFNPLPLPCSTRQLEFASEPQKNRPLETNDRMIPKKESSVFSFPASRVPFHFGFPFSKVVVADALPVKDGNRWQLFHRHASSDGPDARASP